MVGGHTGTQVHYCYFPQKHVCFRFLGTLQQHVSEAAGAERAPKQSTRRSERALGEALGGYGAAVDEIGARLRDVEEQSGLLRDSMLAIAPRLSVAPVQTAALARKAGRQRRGAESFPRSTKGGGFDGVGLPSIFDAAR